MTALNLARACFLCLLLIFGTFPSGALANPGNPVLQSGAATFSNSGSVSTIHQGSDRVIIHWDSFSIAAGETTRFIQPGANSAALNRVVTGAPSAIHGSLQANGQVYLINPNGILIGPGGRVDTAGFLASTLDVSDAEFLAGGDMTFSGNSRARVTNLGTVTSIDGGDIFLIAKEVINHGTLTAEGGTVGLAGGTRVLVRAEGSDERISILPGSEGGSVTNGTAGQVQAVVAELKAAGGNEYALALNNDGLVRATGFQRRGGKVYLGSGGGAVRSRGRVEAREVKVEAPESSVINEGTIEADESIEIEGGIIDLTGGSGVLRVRNGGGVSLSATEILRINDAIHADNREGAGGSIRLTAPEIVVGNGAEVTANGIVSGGQILIGGGRAGQDPSITNAQNTTVEAGSIVSANAFVGGGGTGGEVILWADGNQRFEGSIEARGDETGAGGFVEVSGLESLSFLGSVDTGGGNLLLDPFNYVIGASQATAIVNALATSNVTIDTTLDVRSPGGADGSSDFGSSGVNTDRGDITVNSAIHYDSAHDLTFLAMGDVNFHASVQNQNATGGDINVVAGWDGTTAYDSAVFLAVDVTSAIPTLYGNGNGSVNIGDGTQAVGVAVGSRSGTTNVFGHDVSVTAGNNALTSIGRFAQLGFQVSDGVAQDSTNLGAAPVVDGAINVHVRNNLSATGGDRTLGYAQVGHVGADESFDRNAEATASSMIEIAAGNNITFAAGGGNDAYAQLGQGGAFTAGDHSGTTTIKRAESITFTGGSTTNAYAQLGQGGHQADSSHSGTTTITWANDIIFTAGSGSSAYAQLGQGGASAEGNHSGTTTITRANNITFTAGSGASAYAQLGQGGRSAAGSHTGTTTIAKANDIAFTGGSGAHGYVQLGQGGNGARGDHGGTTTITWANDIIFTAGGALATYAQLGQGGFGSLGDQSGTTTITRANDITFRGGIADWSYAQLGQGGPGVAGNNEGVIEATLLGDLTLTGQNTTRGYAQIGHGDEPSSGDSGQTVLGDISIRVGGKTTLTNAFFGHQIDFGGTYTSGNTFLGVVGDLSSDASSQFTSAPVGTGELRIYLGGGDNVNPATLLNGTAHGLSQTPNLQGMHVFGTGPYAADPGADGNFAYYRIEQDIYNYTVGESEAAAIAAALVGGDVALDRNLGQFDFGAEYDWDGGSQFIKVDSAVHYDSSNDLSFLATGDITFHAGVQNQNATGGDINVVAGWDGTTAFDVATFEGEEVSAAPTLYGRDIGSGPGVVHIGNGSQTAGVAVGSRSGTTRVFGYDVKIQGGNGAGDHRFAQLGFQVSDGIAQDGTDLDLAATGGVNVVVDGGITVRAQNNLIAMGGDSGDLNYAQLGHVGADLVVDGLTAIVEANATATIEVATGRNIIFEAGSGLNAYAQLGQGGWSADGNHSGTTTIVIANDITFQGGAGSSAYATLGQGGDRADGTHGGTTTIMRANDITFRAGSGSLSYAQLGQGGFSAFGRHGGITTITQANDILFEGGSNLNSYAQLGQGGASAVGNHSGTTTITTANDIHFKGGSATGSYAQLGQGGGSAFGNHSGTTIITTANNITFEGGSGNSTYAQLGQGGENARGNHEGTTTIASASEITFRGGSELGSYAQLGQGGYIAIGNQSGTTTIGGADQITIEGGTGTNVYAQLGQGGIAAFGNHEGVIEVILSGDLTLTGQDMTRRYAQIGHGDDPGDGDSGETVSGDILVRVGGNANLANAFLGHQVDNDGTYTSGNTILGVGEDGSPFEGPETITSDAASRFNSAPSGELRFYLPEPTGYQIAAGTLLNGTPAPAPGTTPLPNEQGSFAFGTGPYVLAAPGNFAFYAGSNPAVKIAGTPAVEPGFQLPDSVVFFFDSRFIEPAGTLEGYPSILDWWEGFFSGWLENGGGNQFSETLEFLPEAGFINTLGSSEVNN